MTSFWLFVKNTWNQLQDFLLPDSYFSWQVVIYLSLFSWAMSWLAWLLEVTQVTLFILTSLSWLFLAIGVGWALEEARIKLFGVPIYPWVTGAIVSLFILGTWPDMPASWVLISWPLISFVVIAVPEFITWELEPRLPMPSKRQYLVFVLFISILLSSWLGFYFRVQSWLDDYPSLLADSFENSRFVYRLPSDEGTVLPQGVSLLSLTEGVLQEEIDNRPWSAVERWLINRDDQVVQVRREVRDRLDVPKAEHQFWEIDIIPVRQNNGYELQLVAIWNGPSADAEGYYQEKICQLEPVERPAASETTSGPTSIEPGLTAPEPETTVWSRFECDLATPRRTGPTS